MDIDIYQSCPCHSGKKIKFCCGKEVVNELGQIFDRINAGQEPAALSLIDRTLEAHGDLPCLLALKTFMLLQSRQLDAAAEANQRFRAAAPDNLLGREHSALIAVSQGDSRGGMNLLQDAVESIEGDTVPLSLANAYRMVALGLARDGFPLAARAHLQFASSLKEDDPQLQRMVDETFRISGIPLILRQAFNLDPVTEAMAGEPWGKSYTNVLRLVERGQFRRALKLARRIDEKFPDQPPVVRALAILPLLVAEETGLSDAWRRRAEVSAADEWERVLAEAIAQLFDPSPASDLVDVAKWTIELTQYDRAHEILTASRRTIFAGELNEDPFRDGPPPRATYVLLDKDELKEEAEPTVETIPRGVADLFLYGKQTDRPARMIVIAPDTARTAVALEALRAELGDACGETIAQERVGETSALENATDWRWHLPAALAPEQARQLAAGLRENSLKQEWAEVPNGLLGGKSAREAAAADPHDLKLRAMLLQLEAAFDSDPGMKGPLEGLSRHLGVPRLPAVQLGDRDPSELPPIQFGYLDPAELTDQQLQEIVMLALRRDNRSAMVPLLDELISREEEGPITRDMALAIKARYVDSLEESVELLQKARKACQAANRPYGRYLVEEFELYLRMGISEPLEPLLHRITQNHMDEPGVEELLASVIQQYRLAASDEGPAPAAPLGMAEEVPDAGGLVLDPSAAAPAASPGQGESKLWLPGQD